jgi:N-acetylglucosaminyldiphosphoundecaprenol N-acetyl-beta-D-mannosaminyltransferase
LAADQTIEKGYFYDIPVSLTSVPILSNVVIEAVRNNEKVIIYGFSLHSIYSLGKNPEIILLGKEADIILTDGRPFYWLCRFHGLKIPDAVSIPESVSLALRIANENKFSLMLLGATREVNNKASARLKERYKSLNLLPGIDGYFEEDSSDRIIKDINRHSPDVLLVGISSPKKERFVFYNRDKINARVIIPCGGVIDILAGTKRQTPKWLKQIGLATLYRVIQEPGRLLADRLKMLIFVFGRLLPLLLFNRFISGKRISLISRYTKN